MTCPQLQSIASMKCFIAGETDRVKNSILHRECVFLVFQHYNMNRSRIVVVLEGFSKLTIIQYNTETFWCTNNYGKTRAQ